jgi:hypothetical protein
VFFISNIWLVSNSFDFPVCLKAQARYLDATSEKDLGALLAATTHIIFPSHEEQS